MSQPRPLQVSAAVADLPEGDGRPSGQGRWRVSIIAAAVAQKIGAVEAADEFLKRRAAEARRRATSMTRPTHRRIRATVGSSTVPIDRLPGLPEEQVSFRCP